MDVPLPEPRRVAIALGATIAFLGTLGAVDLLAPSLPLSVFELDGERTVTALVSAALLLGAAVLAWQLASAQARQPSSRWSWWRFMSVLFAFMALDELLAIHERVSTSVTGVSWQVFYAPVALAAAGGWLALLRRLPPGAARRMWVVGAGAWLVSQVLEAVQWDGDRLVYEWTLVPEEMLEMTGSLLWGLALLLTLRLMRDRPEDRDGEPQPAETSAESDEAFPQRGRRHRRRLRGSERAGQRSPTPPSRTPSSL